MAEQPPKRRAGRPPRSQGPKLPLEEVDRLLVEGELAPGPCGVTVRRWPSQREVARRYGVTSSLVCQFATRYRCAERRAQYQAGFFSGATASGGQTPAAQASDVPDAPDVVGEALEGQEHTAADPRTTEADCAESPPLKAIAPATDPPPEPTPLSGEPSPSTPPEPITAISPEDCDPFVDPPEATAFQDHDDVSRQGDPPQSERRPVAHGRWSEPPAFAAPRPAQRSASPSPSAGLPSVLPAGDPSFRPTVSPMPHWQGGRAGRPLKSEPPRISYEELDKLLVFGEIQSLPDGSTTAVYPSYQQLADRYGVAPSVIADYAKHHNCQRRRKEAQIRIAMRIEERIIQERAETLAVDRGQVVKMIDRFLLGFDKALDEGRVRSDNPTDINTMVRLKEFILGGADSRQELHASFSLQGIQQRYQRAMQQEREVTPALAGVVLEARAAPSATLPAEASEQVLDSLQESSARLVSEPDANAGASSLASQPDTLMSEPADARVEEPVGEHANGDEDR